MTVLTAEVLQLNEFFFSAYVYRIEVIQPIDVNKLRHIAMFRRCLIIKNSVFV
jgi:hypothetical protein